MTIEEMIGKENIAKGKYWRLPWSLISGCTPCSPGCDHCWALAMERRFKKVPTNKWPKSEIEFGGIQIHPERLDIPLKHNKPTVYALWNDIAHESINMRGEFIRNIFRIMAACPDHIFLVLTKRVTRLKMAIDNLYDAKTMVNMLPNVWIGCTAVNQAEADEKIPMLLRIPAAIRFLSIEPMLSEIHIEQALSYNKDDLDPEDSGGKYLASLKGIDWVILGGETGPGARPMHPDWARSVRDQCQAAGVPLFFKQWGEWGPLEGSGAGNPTPICFWNKTRIGEPIGWMKGFTTENTPHMVRIGKKSAGRLLDGREWNEVPEAK